MTNDKMPHWGGDGFVGAETAYIKSIHTVQLRKLRRSI